jgi:spermidine synthase
MTNPSSSPSAIGADVRPSALAGVSLISAALLMTELALTRIFSVTMYYHFAFLAISIALFGLSASGVYVYLARRLLTRWPVGPVLAVHALSYAVVTTVSLAVLLRLRVGLNYSLHNLVLMLAIYALAALPFFAGGSVLSLAISRLSARINLVYAADLGGAALGCLLLLPLLDHLGAPGVIFATAVFGAAAAVCFSPGGRRVPYASAAAGIVVLALVAHAAGVVTFDVSNTKGHVGDRVLFSKWNSFSRIAVYDRAHGDWSLSPRYTGPLPETRFMDIDSAASTPILRFHGDVREAEYLRYELTALAYKLKDTGSSEDGVVRTGQVTGTDPAIGAARADAGRPFTALVIGPGGGRDLLSALVFGASRVDGVEINPIIANDVMHGQFRAFSGGLYDNPRVRIFVEDGRSFVRRSPDRYDIIQASLVDTWAATAAGAYTLTENSLYTVEAFNDYLDHLNDDGVLTITRWVFDGLRLVSLAQEACAQHGWEASTRLAIVQQGRVATFLLKKSPFTAREVTKLKTTAQALGFTILYVPPADGTTADPVRSANGDGAQAPDDPGPGDYARLIEAPDRLAFYAQYPLDIRPTTDDRPFFFHTTKLKDQTNVAFGRAMLFGNGLSALMTLMAISGALVLLFILGPLALTGRGLLGSRWLGWLAYFGLLGAGFMLIEVALLQRFVLLLGHPVYSLTVTLFSLLVGGGLGSYLSRRFSDAGLRRGLLFALAGIVVLAVFGVLALPAIVRAGIAGPLAGRIAGTAVLLIPAGLLMGIPLPAGIRMLSARRAELIPWVWAINGALSVVGATLAVFIAMNWGFSVTLMTGASCYVLAAAVVTTR